jgi:hypothetical protein
MNRTGEWLALGGAVMLGAAVALAQQNADPGSPFQVLYRVGDLKRTYHMTASNQDVHRDLRYEADRRNSFKSSTGSSSRTSNGPG